MESISICFSFFASFMYDICDNTAHAHIHRNCWLRAAIQRLLRNDSLLMVHTTTYIKSEAERERESIIHMHAIDCMNELELHPCALTRMKHVVARQSTTL